VLTRQSAEERAGLVLREHDGQATRALGPRDSIQPRHLDSQHLAVEEEEGGERLVLRGRRNVAVVGEGGKERGDVLGSQVARMAPPMEEDVAADPVDVRVLRPDAVVAVPDAVADLVEKAFRGLVSCRICRRGRRVCHCRYRQLRQTNQRQ
jgi:hypothetical protein